MALKIRLRQQGRNNRQTYRLVVTDIRNKRDGKYLENLGWYNPLVTENCYAINAERTLHWLNLGAEISHDAKVLVGKAAPEVMKTWHSKRQAKRVKMCAQRRGAKKEQGSKK